MCRNLVSLFILDNYIIKINIKQKKADLFCFMRTAFPT